MYLLIIFIILIYLFNLILNILSIINFINKVFNPLLFLIINKFKDLYKDIY